MCRKNVNANSAYCFVSLYKDYSAFVFFVFVFRQIICFGFLNINNITRSRGKTQVTASDAANENDAHKPSSAADYKHFSDWTINAKLV